MAIYQVVIDEIDSIAEVMRNVKRHYSNHYQHHSVSQLIFLRTKEESTGIISTNLGINGEDDSIVGSVMKLNGYYSGYTHQGLWEWLDTDE